MKLHHLSRFMGFCLFVSAALLAPRAAQAGLFDDDEARKAILDLRQKIEASAQTSARQSEDARKAAEESNAALRRSLLDLQNQIETLRTDVAKLRGQEEQLARDVADVQRRQKDIAQGVDERMRQLEPAKINLDGREFTANPAEKRDFEAALAVFRKGDFSPAQAAFIDFIKRNPQSGYNPSALFWLGNAQYATRDYREAVSNFRSMLAQAPDHAKASEAALSIANCQVELKDPRSARKTLEDLIKVYPQSEAALAAKDRLAKMPR